MVAMNAPATKKYRRNTTRIDGFFNDVPTNAVATQRAPINTDSHEARTARGIALRLYFSNASPVAKRNMTDMNATEYTFDKDSTLPFSSRYMEQQMPRKPNRDEKGSARQKNTKKRDAPKMIQ